MVPVSWVRYWDNGGAVLLTALLLTTVLLATLLLLRGTLLMVVATLLLLWGTLLMVVACADVISGVHPFYFHLPRPSLLRPSLRRSWEPRFKVGISPRGP
jgi:hypothetical protein